MRRISGSHVPNIKNRSSKHLGWFTNMKPIVKCMSGEQLQKLSNNGDYEATKEINRRAKKHSN